jgi:hypothetical protein
MDCRDCPHYVEETRRCAMGKINPQRKSQAVEVVNIFGVRALCTMNDYREWLAESRHSRTERKK